MFIQCVFSVINKAITNFFAFFTRRYINKKNRQNVWVVGGLIGVNESWNRNRGLVSDFDNATLAGVYKISNYGGNNNPNIDYGVLCVYSIEGYIMQTAYSVWGNKVAYRARTEKELWSDWMSL